jgi:hypothetical protein
MLNIGFLNKPNDDNKNIKPFHVGVQTDEQDSKIMMMDGHI